MFTGSVCGQVRDWFRANSAAFSGHKVLSGCCGNFTIETVLSQAMDRPSAIVSNDVSLYTSALGAYFTDMPLTGISVVDEGFKWVEPYLETTESLAAAFVVLLEAAPFSGCKTAYHKRIFAQYLEHFESYHAQATERLQKRKDIIAVDEYVPMDVVDFWETRREEGIFLSFMPTYGGGYEKLYAFLDSLITWEDRPGYKVMDLDKKTELLRQVHEYGNYVHIDDTRRDDMNVMAIVAGGRGRPVYIHSDLDSVKSELYSRGGRGYKKPTTPVLKQDEVLACKEIGLVILQQPEFAWVRDQHLSRSIMPAEPSWRYAVCLDGRIVGLLGWQRGHDGASYYMLCDLGVKSEVYNRISKLVLMVANSKEMHRVLRQQTGKFWKTFDTTAFTKKPASMKYRGVLDLTSRNKKEGKLNYRGNFSGTFDKALKKWKKMEQKAKNA